METANHLRYHVHILQQRNHGAHALAPRMKAKAPFSVQSKLPASGKMPSDLA